MNAINQLTVSDLNTSMDGEPRVRDVDLGERLGFERPRKIREIIERNRAELEGFGGLPRRGANPGPLGGRPTFEYHLNEGQSLLVSTLSQAPKAPQVRRMLIEVFMAWRRGDLPAAPVTVVPALADMQAQDISARCRLVNTARLIYGPLAAAEIYEALGLPVAESRAVTPTLAPHPEADRAVDGPACLGHLAGRVLSGRPRVTLGEAILTAVANAGVRMTLEAKGILVHPAGWIGYVAIDDRHPFLLRGFALTLWAADWLTPLTTVPGARLPEGRVPMNGRKRRAVLIPLAAVRAVMEDTGF